MTDTFPTSPDEHVSGAANPVTGGTEAANSSGGDLITDAAAISGGSRAFSPTCQASPLRQQN